MITVIMPVYNDKNYIVDAIRGVLNQTYKNFELVIVDDASTDGTKEIIEKFKDEKIKLIRNNKNLGGEISRNIAIKKSKGELLFFTDSDCIVDKNWIKEGLKTLKKKKF